jgi:rare lipoprotein A
MRSHSDTALGHIHLLFHSVVAAALVRVQAYAALLALALVVDAPAAFSAQAAAAGTIESKTGLASYYSRRLEGRKTASGEKFRNDELVAAHRTYPLGTLVRVNNLENGEAVDVRITDREASAQNRREGVIIDVSQAAATRLKMKKDGRVKVRVDVVEWGQDEKSIKR